VNNRSPMTRLALAVADAAIELASSKKPTTH
jgi:hypothetical protein